MCMLISWFLIRKKPQDDPIYGATDAAAAAAAVINAPLLNTMPMTSEKEDNDCSLSSLRTSHCSIYRLNFTSASSRKSIFS